MNLARANRLPLLPRAIFVVAIVLTAILLYTIFLCPSAVPQRLQAGSLHVVS